MRFLLPLLLLASFAFPVPSPVSHYGKFQADGPLLKSSKTGNAMQVKGVSFFWSHWSGDFYNENAVNRMARDWKAEVVRAAYGATSNAFSSNTAAENRARVDTIVNAAVANDIYVIIDWHSHTAHEAAETERAKQFFSYFAQKYGHLDNVIFELYNEPLNANWDNIKEYALAVIPVIREYSSNLILVGTPRYSLDVDDAATSPIEDPNLGYVFHFYAAEHSLGAYRNKIINTQGSSLPIFVTEFGTTVADGGNPDKGHYNSHSKEKTDEWLAFLNSRKISYCAWSLFDKYEGSAFFGIDPNKKFNQVPPENWTDTTLMTASGRYIFNMLRESYENPTPILKGAKNLKQGLAFANGKIFINAEKTGYMRLNAYSLNGTLAKTLFEGHLQAGNHEFMLEISQGVYIIKADLPSNSEKLITIITKK